MKRLVLSLIVLFYVLPVFSQEYLDTFHIYFDLNVPALNKNMEKKIDLLMYNDKILAGTPIMVVGYADFIGSDQYNKNLSMLRAKNVRDYLVQYGINPDDIKLCMGKGEVKRKDTTDKEGSPMDRKVDIVVNNKSINSEQNRHFRATAGNTKPTKTVIVNGGGGASASGNNKSSDVKELTSLKAGQTLLLKNVYFPSGSHVIKSESFETLEKLFQTLKDHPNLKISIEGHVCCIHGDVPDALDIDTNEPLLSVNRAKAIKAYLVKRGIEEDRLQYVGYGKQHPIVAFERTEEDADKNRRVEIRIVSNQ